MEGMSEEDRQVSASCSRFAWKSPRVTVYAVFCVFGDSIPAITTIFNDFTCTPAVDLSQRISDLAEYGSDLSYGSGSDGYGIQKFWVHLECYDASTLCKP